MQPRPVQSFYQQIAANRRQSLFLVFVLTALLAVFGFVIGYALSGSWQGGGVAVVIAVVLSLFLTSDLVLLRRLARAQRVGSARAAGSTTPRSC